ncbi:hypothetical protein [Pseudooceanicola nanhaiensis]|uniref:hypothetical protein n=1 Tax=Pseudooceanicola nanhaiensis TaxID=375761 RepID=UPI001CD81078|nr:hypothetical protein [Pseudooceanicola nanhaiensis]MCA0919820.1 hypothetical protein [Pseudooceanicola nanhaiensis]
MSDRFCTLDRAGGTFTLTLGSWSNTYPLDQMETWLAFYRYQRDHFPKSLKSYDETIRLLEEARKELGDGKAA